MPHPPSPHRPPRKPTEERMNVYGAWCDVDAAIACIALSGVPQDDAFYLARLAHGILGEYHVNPFAVPTATATANIDRSLRLHHPQHAEAAVHIPTVWRSIVTPLGWHPVAWAAKRFQWLKRPKLVPGRFASPTQRRIATAIYYTLRFLPQDEHGETYASIRDLAFYNQCSRSTVQRILEILARKHLLTMRKPPPHTPLATRFTLSTA